MARVTRAWAESETLRGLAFVSPEVSMRHERPGQFVVVRNGDADKPYALASEPGAPELELLLKGETLRRLAPGDTFQVGFPQGIGFPVDEHRGQDLILCAAGTGIAPLRAVVRTVLPARAHYGKVLLFYGQRTATHFAYANEHEAWKAAGIELHLVASEAGRRLQEVVRAHRPEVTQACAYLCGMEPMILDLARILEDLGLPHDRVFLNS